MDSTQHSSWAECQARRGEKMIPASFVARDEIACWLEDDGETAALAVLAPAGHVALERFHGTAHQWDEDLTLVSCPANHANAAALRATLPWLTPVPLGLRLSAGFGDRLGLATPGHVRALRSVQGDAPLSPIAPIFAQQSIREMSRTHRSPEDVLDDATWGAFRAGWREPLGADADHLKTTDNVDACVAARFSFYTIDPGAFVDDAGAAASADEMQKRYAALPWDALECAPDDLLRRYVGQQFDLATRRITPVEEDVTRAAVTYGGAIAHVTKMARHLANKGISHDLEISVDETETPTTATAHLLIAGELRRMGVHWVSLAPRFVGRFEKGIDYIGDLAALREDLRVHAEIAARGRYKLSLHSGSDKFSVYPLIAEATNGMMHLKTAGTSYVEALRVVASVDPPMFREIVALACEHYPRDRATYHVSADLAQMPPFASLPDAALPELLNDIHLRQIVHVTFGTVLEALGPQLHTLLRDNAGAYDAVLAAHFIRHLRPLLPTEAR